MKNQILSLLIGSSILVAPSVLAECVNVSSTKEWQVFEFPDALKLPHSIVSVEGSWTVDANNYSPVSGLTGHTGSDAAKLAPYNDYKYYTAYPFGQLLMEVIGEVTPVTGPTRILISTGRISFRINDNGLGDNAGSLKVCFKMEDLTPKPTESKSHLERALDYLTNW
jgi:hypothetical protein